MRLSVRPATSGTTKDDKRIGRKHSSRPQELGSDEGQRRGRADRREKRDVVRGTAGLCGRPRAAPSRHGVPRTTGGEPPSSPAPGGGGQSHAVAAGISSSADHRRNRSSHTHGAGTAHRHRSCGHYSPDPSVGGGRLHHSTPRRNRQAIEHSGADRIRNSGSPSHEKGPRPTHGACVGELVQRRR